MSKSIGKIFGTGSTGTYGYENNYTNYLQNYNTANYDNTLNNMTSAALNMSQNLGTLPAYQFSVMPSDTARQEAESATFQSYVDRLTPQYQQQTADMQTRLINQGIPVGSEAYERAMGDLQSAQNAALNQAAYQSVLNGQNAYSQSLADSINTAQFNNTAQQSYIDQILSLLTGSVSGYNNQANLYDTQRGIAARQAEAQQSGWNNMLGLINAGANLGSKAASAYAPYYLASQLKNKQNS
ncbi:MAG: hypothetical protein IKR92_02455 [Alphaproteobacteria bacterium]|nr:hypothetical protein [Alphaproteobacteria bacterium]